MTHWCHLIFEEYVRDRNVLLVKSNIYLHFKVSCCSYYFHVTEVDCELVYFGSENTVFKLREKKNYKKWRKLRLLNVPRLFE